MKIALIGTGRMGSRLAHAWARAGHDVVLGSRTPDEIGGHLPVTTQEAAAAAADVVVLAVPWYAFTDVERAVGKLAGKIVIDAMNPLMSSGSLAVGHKTSAAEMVATAFPRARVVKAFNHIYFAHLDNPTFGDAPADAFFCGDDDNAKETVAELATALGFRPVDCGPLKMARHLEPLAALWIQMAFHFGRGPEFVFKLVER